jgi:hypothetical protein
MKNKVIIIMLAVLICLLSGCALGGIKKSTVLPANEPITTSALSGVTKDNAPTSIEYLESNTDLGEMKNVDQTLVPFAGDIYKRLSWWWFMGKRIYQDFGLEAFDLSLFKLAEGKDLIFTEPVVPYTAKISDLEDKFMPFSTDDQKIVDVYSLSKLYIDNGQIKYVRDENVHNQIDIIDLAKGERQRIIPCDNKECYFIDATWVDKDKFIVVGNTFNNVENNDFYAQNIIYYFDLTKKQQKLFKGPKQAWTVISNFRRIFQNKFDGFSRWYVERIFNIQLAENERVFAYSISRDGQKLIYNITSCDPAGNCDEFANARVYLKKSAQAEAEVFIDKEARDKNGCQRFYKVIGWTKNDQKILLTDFTSCKDDSGTVGNLYAINSDGKNLTNVYENFAGQNTVFTPDNTKLIALLASDSNTIACKENYLGKLVIRDLINNKEIGGISAENTEISINEVNDADFTYTAENWRPYEMTPADEDINEEGWPPCAEKFKKTKYQYIFATNKIKKLLAEDVGEYY